MGPPSCSRGRSPGACVRSLLRRTHGTGREQSWDPTLTVCGQKGHRGAAPWWNVDSSERRGLLGQVRRRRVLCPPRTLSSETWTGDR